MHHIALNWSIQDDLLGVKIRTIVQLLIGLTVTNKLPTYPIKLMQCLVLMAIQFLAKYNRISMKEGIACSSLRCTSCNSDTASSSLLPQELTHDKEVNSGFWLVYGTGAPQ